MKRRRFVGKQRPGTADKTLRVFKTSGEELVSTSAEEVGSVRELKLRVRALCGLPRFRQRLLHEGVVLEDDTRLESRMDIQLVLLNFCEATEEEEDELTAAVKSHDVASVEQKLQRPQCPDILETSEGADTPLCAASGNGNMEILHLLLEARADVDAANGEDDTPLSLATIHGNVDVVDTLLKARADTEVGTRDEETPLTLAAAEGGREHWKIARLLLQARADIEATNSDNETPLFVACEFGNEPVVSLLLQARADLNAENCMGRTPMLAASTEDHVRIVRRLARAAVGTESDGAPLRVAAKLGRFQVLRVLLAFRADLEARDPHDRTALSLACDRRKEFSSRGSVVQLLVQARANANAKDEHGLTPLWYAVRHDHLRHVRLLLEAGADRQQTDPRGKTLREAARDNIQVLRLLSNRKLLRMPRKKSWMR
ncbi:unnamed protein product [Symbiodinium natans]|uniref:Ubiquitin-like domain-containing protein n=1 Tax=Symbiodinium natans TaxID=878477 RepID=A0A812RR26_9DINO|nr:unnamed protein product [Symbiodinium natans]